MAENTTILVTQATRRRIKRLAGRKDVTYDELVNESLDGLEDEP